MRYNHLKEQARWHGPMSHNNVEKTEKHNRTRGREKARWVSGREMVIGTERRRTRTRTSQLELHQRSKVSADRRAGEERREYTGSGFIGKQL